MNNVNYLIVSSTFDYSTDLICYGLEKSNKKYLRLNRDKFSDYDIEYNLQSESLIIHRKNNKYLISDDLKAVYFRAPVFLRTTKNYTLKEQLYRSQWSAFVRNLIIFENIKWINNPINTYRAENKLYQLKIAKQIGFKIPKTYVGNSVPTEVCSNKNNYIVKSLDAALFYNKGQEMFTYSTIINGQELSLAETKDAPIIIQECLSNKLDIRVTVVGNEIFPVSISNNGYGIVGDWRKLDKANLTYKSIALPCNIKKRILILMNKLGLVFGGIDLIFSDNEYYFIEVNPTGEWGWLTYTADLPINDAIVNSLIGGQ